MADLPEQKIEQVKTIVAVFNNPPRMDATVLFCDATQSSERLAKTLGRTVEDITPEGRIELQKPALQITKDITRRTSEKTVKGVLRAVMASKPELQRVGVICHYPHVPFVNDLREPFKNRVVKVAHFGSGEDRSSNGWYKCCDLIVVLGTPRVPPHALKVYLFQTGEIEAACREPEWGLFRWRGKTESGGDLIVEGLGYAHDQEWQDAHRDLVRAGIVQAVGRGRGVMANGCEVVVVSTEECGLPLADNQKLEPMTDCEIEVLQKLADLTDNFPNIDLIRSSVRYSELTDKKLSPLSSGLLSVSTADVAAAAGFSEKKTRRLLIRLESRRLAVRLGERSGWQLSDLQLFSRGRPPHSP